MPTQLSLQQDFPPVSYTEWRTKAEEDLKGAPFEKKLLTPTYEGITLQPIYRQEDIEGLPHLGSMPGFPPYARGKNVDGYLTQCWHISQILPYPNPRDFNSAARLDLSRGLTALNLHLDAATRAGLDPDWAKDGEVGKGGVSIATLRALSVALEDINLEVTPVYVRSGASGLPFAALFAALVKQRDLSFKRIRGCIEMDPLGVLAHEGTLPQSLEEAYREMAQLTRWARANTPNVQTITIHGRPFHESGASAVQELGITLAIAVEYFREMEKHGLSVDDVAPHTRFSLCVGSQFFTEVAKLRAARILWAKIIKSSGGSDDSAKINIHASTCLWNKTKLDPYVNMLRATTEAFSSVIGGCDSLQVGAFDEVYGLPDEFSRRIARNTQIILQHEASLRRLIDPAGGSWYVEWLTDQVAREAWKFFQQIEQKGGAFAALQSGFIQAEVQAVGAKKQDALAKRKDVLVGTNQYANISEKPLPCRKPDLSKIYHDRVARVMEYRTSYDSKHHTRVLEKLARVMDSTEDTLMEAAIEAAECGATLGEISRVIRTSHSQRPVITPLKPHRLAEPFEELRQASEDYKARNGHLPRVFLANMGPLRQHKARADFIRSFFETGGFEVIYPKGHETTEQAARASLDSGAPIVVICSTDETYPEIVPGITRPIKSEKPEIKVVLAGYPQEQIDAHKAAGVDDFIHIRSNIYETLASFLKTIGALK